MKTALLEPFYGGSHKHWADSLKSFSSHEIRIFSLKGYHWKWRMHGGAVTLAEAFNKSDYSPDLILASDMLDLNLFLSLTRNKTHDIPTAVYFHENQLNYPWSPIDRDVKKGRDNHYSFINYTTALTADRVFFNSEYHRSAFISELPRFLNAFPDHRGHENVKRIESKSSVLPLGMDLDFFDPFKKETRKRPERAVILWNHRWEYDKNPDLFFKTLVELEKRGIEFNLILIGSKTEMYPPVFDEMINRFKSRILHSGYLSDRNEYAKKLLMADLLPVTSYQDFFGGSVVEAMYCNVIPLFPKRLAYPGHIPEKYHNAFFYDDERDLANRLHRNIRNVKLMRKQKTDHFVSRYDWSRLIGQYDTELDEMVR